MPLRTRSNLVRYAFGLFVSAAGITSASSARAYDWLQFNGDAQHSGSNRAEAALSTTTVTRLSQRFRIALPAVADGAPVVLTGVPTASGARDLLFITTKAGHILALDAHSGATIWAKQFGPGTCRINGVGGSCYTTSSPALDSSKLFVYSYGLEGGVHKFSVADGSEVTTGGFPELVTTKPFDEKGSSPLVIATAANGVSYLYATHGGYPGDNGDYQGHLTAIDLANGTQHVFNAMCSDQTVHFQEKPGTPDCAGVRSALWARSGVVYDAEKDVIFAATGNGDYVPASHDWGDTVFSLRPDGTGTSGNPVDSYTPTDFQALSNADADLGSTAPAILPTLSSGTVRRLAVQGGKDAMLRLLNLDNLSGQGAPGHVGGELGAPIAVPQGGLVFSAPAVWTNPADLSTWVFVGTSSGTSALKLGSNATGTPQLTLVWKNTMAATSPLVANGVLYTASSGTLRALAATTGSLLWSGAIGGIHWQSPVVANGTLYITDESGNLDAFTAPAAPAVAATPPIALWSLAALLVGCGALAIRTRKGTALRGVRTTASSV